MSLLDRFLDEQNKSFDFTSFATEEFLRHDGRRPPPFLYKYLSEERKSFFQKPSFRYTQAAALNDQFEFCRRWDEFAPKAAKELFSQHLRQTFQDLCREREIIVELLKEEALRRGKFLDGEEMAAIRHFIRSKDGKLEVQRVLGQAISAIDLFVEHAFCAADKITDKLDKFGSEFGVFSMCETPDNQQLWALYASEGRGFCVELDTANSFFCAPNNRPLIWKVSYSDDNESGFLSNPLVLFLRKNRDWQFEREWRSLKRLSDCDATIRPLNDIYIRSVTSGLISSVIFGYRYDDANLLDDAHMLERFDNGIRLRKAILDRSSRKLLIRDL